MEHPGFYIGVPTLIIVVSAGFGLAYGLAGSAFVAVIGIAICAASGGKAAVFGLPVFIGGLIAAFVGHVLGLF